MPINKHTQSAIAFSLRIIIPLLIVFCIFISLSETIHTKVQQYTINIGEDVHCFELDEMKDCTANPDITFAELQNKLKDIRDISIKIGSLDISIPIPLTYELCAKLLITNPIPTDRQITKLVFMDEIIEPNAKPACVSITDNRSDTKIISLVDGEYFLCTEDFRPKVILNKIKGEYEVNIYARPRINLFVLLTLAFIFVLIWNKSITTGRTGSLGKPPIRGQLK
ncbi:hypothetical protein KKF55_01405 [Patescibacteria group bacterium]|nr:hypothetical protein [Patescibacteria group bacterium]